MAQFFALTDLGLPSSSAELLQTWLENIQATYPSYTPSQANLEYIHAQVISALAADLAQLCASGGTELFRQFGTKLLGLPYQTGNPASAVLTITAADTAGYTLPGGTQLTLTLNGAPVGFQTTADLTIVAGLSSGTVNAMAVQPGTAFNAAGSPAQLVSQITWVSSVAVVTAAAGGTDAEDDTHYLNRLVQTLQLLAPRPITAPDYATIALDFTPASGTDQQDVGRATAIDGYDPGAGTFNNQREVTVCITDATGNALNSDTLTAVAAWFQTLREANFIVNVVSPNYSTVYVACSVHPLAGWANATVQANVQTSLLSYLSPPNWGLPPAQSVGWTNYTTVYRSKVEAVIQNTAGVDFVKTGTLAMGLSASPTNTTNDLLLPGPFPLPTTTTSSVPTSAITIV